MFTNALSEDSIGVLPDEAARPSRRRLAESEVFELLVQISDVIWIERDLFGQFYQMAARVMAVQTKTNHVRHRVLECKASLSRLNHGGISAEDNSVLTPSEAL